MLTAQVLDKLAAWLFRVCPDCHGTSHINGKTCCGCGGNGTLKL